MSRRYKGAIISATPPTTTTTSAPGEWTLQQQLQAQAAGTWPAQPIYVEDLFSTYLYTGNGTTQTITNNVDTSTYGGMTWIKCRSTSENNCLFDTKRGATNYVFSILALAQVSYGSFGLTAFNSNGFTVTGGSGYAVNTSAATYSSCTFRKQPKFFDIVTYAGNGATQNIAHNLGSVPGCILIKSTDLGRDWAVYHKTTGNAFATALDTTAAARSFAGWNSTTPTASVFSLGADSDVNSASGNYVAYLFADNAGGFGVNSTDSVIACGGWAAASPPAGGFVNLGWEPQWIMFRRTDIVDGWRMYDARRGWPATGSSIRATNFYANTNAAEGGPGSNTPQITPTGFYVDSDWTGNQFIYVAVRKGPMKVPTDATTVFAPVVVSAPTANQAVTTNFPVDVCWTNAKNSSTYGTLDFDELRGAQSGDSEYLQTQSSNGKVNTGSSGTLSTQSSTGVIDNSWNTLGYVAGGAVYWNFRRAPGFFDEVCYTGTGAATTVTHNLGAVPQLIIVKKRSTAGEWATYNTTVGNTKALFLNNTNAPDTNTYWNNTTPTSSVFTVGALSATNALNENYVAYLFTTLAGVSKVGTYSGTGATQTIDCGFTGGARFVLIKRYSTTGDWYVWDTARGMVAGTDPYLLLDSTAAEVNANNVYTITTGFQIVGTGAGINASGSSYIYLAIA